MKLNMKVYKNLTSSPFETQKINGKTVEFHSMNNTPFLFQYASKGRFAIWASDGVNYKVLIEDKYYEAMKDFYQQPVNEIWLGFLGKIGGINKKINMMFIIPTLFIYAIVAILTSIFWDDQMLQVLLGLLVVIIFSNMIQNRIVSKKVREENAAAQDRIRQHLGVEEFDQLIKRQEAHYQEYFKFNEEVSEEEVEIEEKIEVEAEEKDESNSN